MTRRTCRPRGPGGLSIGDSDAAGSRESFLGGGGGVGAELAEPRDPRPARGEPVPSVRRVAFDTTAERYAWLTQSLFLARGRLRGARAIEYEVYRVR